MKKPHQYKDKTRLKARLKQQPKKDAEKADRDALRSAFFFQAQVGGERSLRAAAIVAGPSSVAAEAVRIIGKATSRK